MSLFMVVSVGSLDIHGVWGDEGRLPHGTGVTRGSRGLSAGWREFLDLFDFHGFRVLLRGVGDVERVAPPRTLVSSSVGVRVYGIKSLS